MSTSNQLSRVINVTDYQEATAEATLTPRSRAQSFSGTPIFGRVSSLNNITKLLIANRGEIAIRICRAAGELQLRTVAIYAAEEEFALHRFRADESYVVGKGLSPLRAYLEISEIIRVCKESGANAIHPGYGFLSENADLVKACEENDIIFVGPSRAAIAGLGDKVSARTIAKNADVPIVPGTPGPVGSVADAKEFCAKHGYPVLIKAAFGGGGRGMRIVREPEDLESSFDSAVREAEQAFGNGMVFIERYLLAPRHIEVQVIGDKQGNITHLYERDCSIQRRHQKVVEMAPAQNLPKKTKESIFSDAVKIAKFLDYSNAGTVEFLYEPTSGQHFFIEVNPRLQVEHTVTEQYTGIDIVKSQICIADGYTLEDCGIVPGNINTFGVSIQCRLTTEDPKAGFKPDTGRIQVYRAPGGPGIRLDSSTTAGSVVSPYYDSMLAKLTASAASYAECIRRLSNALSEFRLRGVKTNIGFLQMVLHHPKFLEASCSTTFIDETPELFKFSSGMDRTTRLLNFLGDLVVNGNDIDPALFPDMHLSPIVPEVPAGAPPPGWRDILLKDGPKGFASAIRSHKSPLITDTTWRDAHQSLLATRIRTVDLVKIASVTSHHMSKLFSIECWGGATFDVCLRFLHECPWARIERLRELVPNIPFQMLLRGANAVGYTSYPDNVVNNFVKKAVQAGVDIFRVFDSLNYIPNLEVGIKAIHLAGGVVEAVIVYSGDCSKENAKYDVAYYMKKVEEIYALGIHILCIKDPAGTMKPQAAKMLIGKLREKYPDLPIHLHTHDTPGVGVATYLAALEAGADIVDCATDALSGLTSQPSMGAVVGALSGTDNATELDAELLIPINDYWEETRKLYKPFESFDLRSGNSDVYIHEMPGGQYTNLQFQAASLGLSGRWPAVKRAYAAANKLCGEIVKVTPSSKVVGDFAQFMVANNLTADQVMERAQSLDFPESVIRFFQGALGQPEGGFPDKLRKDIIRDLPPIDERPGKSMPDYDFNKAKQELMEKFPDVDVRDEDVTSYSLYPKVTTDFLKFKMQFGDLHWLPTLQFLRPMEINQSLSIPFDDEKDYNVQLLAVGRLTDGLREVFWDVNGTPRLINVPDRKAAEADASTFKPKATDAPGSIGAPMTGLVVEYRVETGQQVKQGDALLVLSAMKMETVISTPIDGTVDVIHAPQLSNVQQGELLVTII